MLSEIIKAVQDFISRSSEYLYSDRRDDRLADAMLMSVKRLQSLEHEAVRPISPLRTLLPDPAAASTKDWEVAYLHTYRMMSRAEQLEALAIAPPKTESGTDGAWLSVTDLATKYGMSRDAARKRLDRWRSDNRGSDAWTEVNERRPRAPKYLYREYAVRHLFQSPTSSERPAKKIRPPFFGILAILSVRQSSIDNVGADCAAIVVPCC